MSKCVKKGVGSDGVAYFDREDPILTEKNENDEGYGVNH